MVYDGLFVEIIEIPGAWVVRMRVDPKLSEPAHIVVSLIVTVERLGQPCVYGRAYNGGPRVNDVVGGLNVSQFCHNLPIARRTDFGGAECFLEGAGGLGGMFIDDAAQGASVPGTPLSV